MKLRIVALAVLLGMLFGLNGLLVAPVYAASNLSIEPEPTPGDPALCMEDVSATVSWMNKFNLIVLDNVNAPGFTHIDGGAYIGGNYNATGASDFALQSGPTCADNSLTIVGTVIAGGDLKVLNGNALTGQPTSSRIAMNSGCTATVDNTLTNTAIKAGLNAASSAFAAETANNIDPTIDGSGKLIFNVDFVTTNNLAVFNVTTAQVFASAANNQIEFIYGAGISPATTTILVNVSGSDVDWTSNASFGSSVENNAARIIWNFHNATTIDFNKQWFGAMLAPLATLNANSQNLTGSIAVKNITGAGEVHKPRFASTNTIPLKDVCENPPDETTSDSVCADVAGGPFNQLKVDVNSDGPPYASWEYNPLVGATTSGTATYLGGSTAAGQSYAVPPFGTIAISTTTASGTIIAYDRTQTNPRTNWTSTFGIDHVLIKAGPGSNGYIYSPEAYSDYLLQSPKDSISHVTFCWDSEITPLPGIKIKKYTNGEDADTPTGPVVAVGSTVTWTYVISNTGNVVLSDIVLTDNVTGVTPVYVSGDTNTDNKLDLDEIWLYRTTGIATAGQYANIGTVTGLSPDEDEVSDSDPSHYFGAEPGIAIKKYTNGEDADTSTGPVVNVGSTVTWTYIISNTGNVVLSNIVVTDNITGVTPVYISGDTNTDGKLDLNEIWLYRTTGIAIAGQYANIGTVKGDSPDGKTPTDDDPSHYFGEGPGIAIKKYTNGEDADTPTGPIVVSGSTVTWTYIVSNTGNVVLSNVVVTDNITGVTPVYVSGDTNADNKLDLDEIWLFRATGIATAGQYANVGTVTGKSPEAKEVTDNDPSHYFGEGPAIAIKKYTNGEDADDPTGPVVAVGSTVTWTYIVSNIGDVILSNVVVTDNITGVTPVYISGDTNADNKLDLDEIWLYRTTGIATIGQYANVGTVKGESPERQEVSDSDPSHYFGALPGIAIKKYTNGADADTATGPVVNVGSTVTWTYIVSNTGNVILSNVVVTDNIAGVNPVYISGDTNNDGKLDLGEIWLFRATGIATAGQYANVGTVKGNSPDGKTPTDDDPSHYFGSTPEPEVAALGDRVWHDLNANGVQDDGEQGVANVTVTLMQGDCTTPTGHSMQTNNSGIYGFSNLTPGSYCVVFTVPNGYSVSPQNVGNDALDSDGDSSGKTTSVTLIGGETNNTIDLGIYQPAALGNRVWIDANENGKQDDGEANVEGVTVTLFNSNNQQVGNPTTTNASGLYSFTNLVPGTYYVIFDPATLPDDYVFTTPNANGVVDSQDSDADAIGKTPSVTLKSGDNYLDLDAGIYLPTTPPPGLAALGDTVWYDVNKNGIQDNLGTPTGEKGVAGVIVNLYTSAGVFVKTDTTDSNGEYLFTDLQPGTYYVEFAPVEGYSFTRYNVNSDAQNAADSDPLVPYLEITITNNEEDAELGEPLTYTVHYSNTDATLVATNVVISTTVPDGTTFNAAASNPGWQCTNANPGGVCTLTLPILAANGSGSALFVVNLSTNEPDVPDQLDLIVDVTQGSLARTENVTLAAGESNLTVDAGLVIIETTLTTPTPTSPTNLPDGEQPQQQRAIFLPTVRSGQ